MAKTAFQRVIPSHGIHDVQLLDAFDRHVLHSILIMMSLPGLPAIAGIFDNPG